LRLPGRSAICQVTSRLSWTSRFSMLDIQHRQRHVAHRHAATYLPHSDRACWRGRIPAVNQTGQIINTNMQLHSKVPLVPLSGLVPFRVPCLFLVLGRTRCSDNAGVNNASPPHHQTTIGKVIVDLCKQLLTQLMPLKCAGNRGSSSRPVASLKAADRETTASIQTHRVRLPCPDRSGCRTATCSKCRASSPAGSVDDHCFLVLVPLNLLDKFDRDISTSSLYCLWHSECSSHPQDT